VIHVHPPPFTLSPPSLTVTAGDGTTPVLIVWRDPALQLNWSVSLDGPGSIGQDDWSPEVLYSPPSSIAVATVATVHVFTLDNSYIRDLAITINPR
jgi:hypothetical protein